MGAKPLAELFETNQPTLSKHTIQVEINRIINVTNGKQSLAGLRELPSYNHQVYSRDHRIIVLICRIIGHIAS